MSDASGIYREDDFEKRLADLKNLMERDCTQAWNKSSETLADQLYQQIIQARRGVSERALGDGKMLLSIIWGVTAMFSFATVLGLLLPYQPELASIFNWLAGICLTGSILGTAVFAFLFAPYYKQQMKTERQYRQRKTAINLKGEMTYQVLTNAEQQGISGIITWDSRMLMLMPLESNAHRLRPAWVKEQKSYSIRLSSDIQRRVDQTQKLVELAAEMQNKSESLRQKAATQSLAGLEESLQQATLQDQQERTRQQFNQDVYQQAQQLTEDATRAVQTELARLHEQSVGAD
jgi:hypothetical protein